MRRSTWGLLDVLDRHEDWDKHARCGKPDVDPDLFWPVSRAQAGLRQAAAAATYCAQCPVIDACRAYKDQHPEIMGGVWAGVLWPDFGHAYRQRPIDLLAMSRPEDRAKEVAHA